MAAFRQYKKSPSGVIIEYNALDGSATRYGDIFS
jgi:hypothetical protein